MLPQLELLCPQIEHVVGNCDRRKFFTRQDHIIFEKKGLKFFAVHKLFSPEKLSNENIALISRCKPDVIVFGHTHQPCIQVKEGHLFLNPGQTGRGTAREKTAILMMLDDEDITINLYRLTNSVPDLTIQKTLLFNRQGRPGAKLHDPERE